MTGEKNRFTTSEKLWDLDDKQLKSPVHDAMVLWLMDEDNLKALLYNCCYKDTYEEITAENYKLNGCSNVSLDYESEKTIMSSRNFIAGYADLVVEFRFRKYISKEKCPINQEWYGRIKSIKYPEDMEKLLQEYHNDSSFVMKEFCGSYPEVFFKETERGLAKTYFSEDADVIKKMYPTSRHWETGKEYIPSSNLFKDFWKNAVSEEYNRDCIDWIVCGQKYIVEEYACNCLIEVKPYIDSFGAVLRQINSYKQFYNKRTYVHDHMVNTTFCLFTFDKRFDKQFESQGIKVLHPWTSKEDMLNMYGLR